VIKPGTIKANAGFSPFREGDTSVVPGTIPTRGEVIRFSPLREGDTSVALPFDAVHGRPPVPSNPMTCPRTSYGVLPSAAKAALRSRRSAAAPFSKAFFRAPSRLLAKYRLYGILPAAIVGLVDG
jgi:hypothetical protein